MPRERAFQEKHRRIAKQCARRLVHRNWRDRRRTIEATVQSVRRDMGSFAADTMVASILEQLEISDIVDNDQALVFAMSDNAVHQVAACDWFIVQSLTMRAAATAQPYADEVLVATIH